LHDRWNGIISICLFSHPPGFVEIPAVISASLFISAGNMIHRSGKPVQNIEDFPGFSVFDSITELEMGIAVNTGRVVVGNIGSEKRTKYGAVGAEVNFTGRVES